MTEKTIEKDSADKLSRDVAKELSNEYNIEEDEAEEIGEIAWLNESGNVEPNKKKITDKISNFISRGKFEVNEILSLISSKTYQSKCIFVTISSVKRSDIDNKVKISLSHPNIVPGFIKLEPKSVELANLLEYKSVDNPKNLEGEKLIIDPSKISRNQKSVLVPNNVSKTGKLRFKSYATLRNVMEKIRIHTKSGLLNYFSKLNRYIGSVLWFIPLGGFPYLVSEKIAFAIWLIPVIWFSLVLCSVVYSGIWVMLYIFANTLKTELKEVKTLY